MNKNNTYKRIKSYLYNTMSPKNRAAFETELQHNKALAKKLKAQKIEHQVMEAVLENDLRKDLKAWDQELDGEEHQEKPKPKNRFGGIHFIWLAISLLLMALVLFYPKKKKATVDTNTKESIVKKNMGVVDATDSLAIQTPNNIEKEDLAKSIAKTPTINTHNNEKTVEKTKNEQGLIEYKESTNKKTSVVRPEKIEEKAIPKTQESIPIIDTEIKGDSLQQKKDSIIINYAAIDEQIETFTTNETSRSEAELRSITQLDSTNLAVKYDLGLLYYIKGNFIKAAKSLEIFGQSKTDYFYEERAQLVLVMAYLKSEETTQANILLEKIVKNKDHQYYEDAVKLQKTLNQQGSFQLKTGR